MKTFRKPAVLFLLSLLLLLSLGLHAQTGSGFGSVQAVSSNPEYKYLPVINLGSSDRLTVSFDDLQDRDMLLRYRVVHLNTDGSRSSLREIEYVSGINKTDISQVELSFNTRTNYVHYRFEFPQANRNVKVSGAYAFEIFESSDPENVLLRVPFMVCEPHVKVKARAKVPRRVEWRLSRQELEVELDAQSSPVRILQAKESLKVYAQQNLNTQTIRRLPMLYQTGDTYFYKDQDALVFDGLNEFRNFDIRPVRHSGHDVEYTQITSNRWNAQLFPQKSREYTPYLSDDDLNGDFAIKAESMEKSDIEAEYVNVHFLLEEKPFPQREIYVIGKFNNWECNEESRMRYEEDLGMHVLSLPLKQGFYDYMFACKENGEIRIPYLEGNHQETENDYYIYVFYREPGGRYDRLLGLGKTNSRDLPE